MLILVATVVFLTVGIAPPHGTTTEADSANSRTGTINYPPQQPTIDGFGDALEFAGRNSIALLRNPGNQAGTVTDVLLRLLTPVLLGFGLLALRGRTKRSPTPPSPVGRCGDPLGKSTDCGSAFTCALHRYALIRVVFSFDRFSDTKCLR